MWQLMRRLPQLRIGLPLSAVAAVALAARPGQGLSVALPVVLLVGLVAGQRVTPFEAAMPVPARHILLARVVTGLAIISLPLAAWLVAARLRGVVVDAQVPVGYGGWVGALELFAMGALGIMLQHAIRPGVLGVSRSVLLLQAMSAILMMHAALFLRPSVTHALSLLAAAAVVFAFTWRVMPPSYQVAPRAAGGVMRWGRGRPRAAHSRTSPADSAASPWRAIARSSVPPWVLFSTLFVGFSGAIGNWVFYLALLSVGQYAVVRPRLRWLQALPISPHLLLLARMAPLLLPLLGVLLIGRFVAPRMLGLDRSYITLGAAHQYSDHHHFESRTNVPLEFWQRAPAGVPPVLRAPWGEASVADTIRFAGVAFYNPYSARTGASRRFVEWQFLRATTAVHGRPISMAEYQSAGFIVPPRTTSSARVTLVGGALALTFVLALAWLAELAHWHVLGRRPWLEKVASQFPAAATLGVAGVHLYYFSKHGTAILESLGAMAALRIAGALPSTPVAAMLAVVPVAIMYGLVYRQARRSEWANAPVVEAAPSR